MKFGYMIDNSAYEPHYLEETSIQIRGLSPCWSRSSR